MAALGEAHTPRARPPLVARRQLLLGGAAGLVGAAAYSSFLLARPLGSTLDPVSSYVGELGARTQPASAFFRASDVLAGLLVGLLALALREALPRDRRREAGRAALAMAASGSGFDGWHPMSCTPSMWSVALAVLVLRGGMQASGQAGHPTRLPSLRLSRPGRTASGGRYQAATVPRTVHGSQAGAAGWHRRVLCRHRGGSLYADSGQPLANSEFRDARSFGVLRLTLSDGTTHGSSCGPTWSFWMPAQPSVAVGRDAPGRADRRVVARHGRRPRKGVRRGSP